MPVVPASGYPYRAYPEQALSEAPASSYQNIQASPSAFGALEGAATERLGGAAETAGNRLADVAITRQNLFNQIAADDATNKVEETTNKILRGDPNIPGDVGFYGLHGEAAMRARPLVQKQIDDLIQGSRKGLQNPMQALKFDEYTRRFRNYTNSEIGQHYDREFDRYAADTATAKVKLAGDAVAIASNNGDLDRMNQALQGGMDSIRSSMGQHSAPPEAIEAATIAFARESTEKWVRAQAIKDPLEAQKFVEQHKDVLGDRYDDLSRLVKVGAEKAQTIEDMARVRGGSIPTGGPGTGEGHVVPQATRIAFARQYAESKGINPDAVVATIAGEGLGRYVGDGGTSFGDFQLHVGGGMGDQAVAAGINIRDPNTWREQAKFAIDQMAANRDKGADWYAGQWHGAPGWAAQSFAQTGSTTQSRSNAPAEDTVTIYAAGPEGKRYDLTHEQAQQFYNYQAKGDFEGSQKYLQTVSAAKAPDTIVGMPLPPHEDGESPDAAIPGLTQRLAEASQLAQKEGWTPQRFANVVKGLRQGANAAYADQQHALRAQKEQRDASDEAIGDGFLRRMTKDSPNYPTTDEVLQSNLSDAKKREMVGFIERQSKPDPKSQISARNTVDLFRRIHEPDDKEDKIRGETDINQAYINGQLTWADKDKLVGDFRYSLGASTKDLETRKAALLKALGPKFSEMLAYGNRNLAIGQDPTIPERELAWKNAVDAKIKDYRDTPGKNPLDLFMPTKGGVANPEYIGSEEFMRSVGAMGNVGQRLSDTTKTPAATAPIPPDLSTKEKIQEAYYKGVRGEPGGITRQQAIEAARALGILAEPTLNPVPIR